eukprot:1115515-Prymnesium_polylepis.6
MSHPVMTSGPSSTPYHGAGSKESNRDSRCHRWFIYASSIMFECHWTHDRPTSLACHAARNDRCLDAKDSTTVAGRRAIVKGSARHCQAASSLDRECAASSVGAQTFRKSASSPCYDRVLLDIHGTAPITRTGKVCDPSKRSRVGVQDGRALLNGAICHMQRAEIDCVEGASLWREATVSVAVAHGGVLDRAEPQKSSSKNTAFFGRFAPLDQASGDSEMASFDVERAPHVRNGS